MDSAVFIGSNKDILLRVYDTQTRAQLAEQLTFLPSVHSMDDLRECANVRWLFSTWGMMPLSEEDIAKYFPHAEAVFYAAGSVQHFARPFLARGIRVFAAYAANAIPVAEFTVSQILLANKGYFQSLGASRKECFPGNYNCTIGILGAGAIGSLVIRMLRAHELRILVYDPFLTDSSAKDLGVEKTDLETIFSTCQTISNHMANNEQTRNLLGYSLFSRMLPNATFINTGRGATVVETDLVHAMTEEPQRVALLDVTVTEPVPESHPFRALSNVFLTPHIAGSMSNEVARMGVYMKDEWQHVSTGQPALYEVTHDMLATMA